MTQEQADFRTRAAAAKRDRMRARLLAATMEACGAGRGVVVDDVVRVAQVSRGAFYRHFQSLDEAVGELVSELIAEIVATAQTVFDDIDDPVLGSAIGSQLLLYRAAMDPPWARFVASTSLILENASLHQVLRRTIGGGGTMGLFRFPALEPAVDAFAGGLLAGVRRLGAADDTPDSYIADLSRLLLRGLGVDEAPAAAAVEAARARILSAGPARLAWWTPRHTE